MATFQIFIFVKNALFNRHIIHNIKYQISYCNQSNTSSMCTVHKVVVKGSSVEGCHTNL